MNLLQLSATISPNTPQTQPAQKITNETPNKTRNSIVGGFAGYGAASVISSSLKEPLIFYSDEIANNIKEELGKENLKSIIDTADKFIEDKKLKEKGLKVFKVSKDIPPEEQQKVMAAVFEGRNAAGKFLYKKSIKYDSKLLKTMADMVSFGFNGLSRSALYMPKSRALLLGQKYAGIETFKELALAAGKFSKLQAATTPVYNGLKYLAIPIILIATCSRNKDIPEGQQLTKKEKFDKFTNFVRNNAAKLSMAAFVPALFMNISNSTKAVRVAQKYASKEIAQAVYTQEGVNAARTLLSTLITGLSAVSGVKVKDWFQKRNDKRALAVQDTSTIK